MAGLGIGVGMAVAAGGSASGPAATVPTSTAVVTARPVGYTAPGYSWYRSMMSDYYGSGTGMMSGPAASWMMTQAGYQWMTGGARAPGWMRGGPLPGFMMGRSPAITPGTVIGALFANAPGLRITPAQAQRLGSQVPAGSIPNRAARTITFTTMAVSLTAIAGPSISAGAFRIAGMTDPAISVPDGARVTVTLVIAGNGMAHGLVIVPVGAAHSAMPMMTAAPSFAGAALWFLGQSTAAGMHTGTITFTAIAPGSYQYLCPVPGHARLGMAGDFTVR